jgi:TRAP-type C4-dicarboxylate transport system permease large subunit
MFPISAQFGIDPLDYVILVIASIGIGVFMPPIGVGLFVACAIAKMNIVDSAKHMAPYLIILVIGLFVITYVPWFTLVLPDLLLPK